MIIFSSLHNQYGGLLNAGSSVVLCDPAVFVERLFCYKYLPKGGTIGDNNNNKTKLFLSSTLCLDYIRSYWSHGKLGQINAKTK